jgi:putative FmdB family regulatory protein
MPLYEYQCEACENQFEIQQKLSEAPLKKCPSCGDGRLSKLISPTSFQLKGGGWYKDLYSSTRPESKKSESA